MDIWLSRHNGNIGRAETYRGVKIRNHNDIIYVSLYKIFRPSSYHNAAGQYWSSSVRVLTQTVGGSWILSENNYC